MPKYNELQYLKEVRLIQDLTKQMQDKHIFITYIDIWRQLCKEGRFFRGYRTYLKYINESRVNGRISELESINKIKA